MGTFIDSSFINVSSDLFLQVLKHSYISFDVFDTLIQRLVSKPEDVFKMVEYIANYRDGVRSKSFAKKRLIAEHKARNIHKGEVTLDEIYENLDCLDEVKSYYRQLEIECEERLCAPKTEVINLLNRCRQEGKKILIITDMYLPRHFFERIFKKFNIYYDYLFISGEEGVTKYTGDLYEVVTSKLDVSPSEILHFGDNQQSDFHNAQKNGFDAILINTKVSKSLFRKEYFHNNELSPILVDYLTNLFEYRCTSGEEKSEQIIGYSIIGPFLFEFCEWLHKTKVTLKLDELWFVAREGYLLKKCYETMFPQEANFIKYVRLSKGLIRFSALSNNLDDFPLFFNSLIDREKYTWRMILSKLLIDDKEKFLKGCGLEEAILDLDEEIEKYEFLEGKYADILKKIVIEQKRTITEQNECLYNYLIQLGLCEKRIGLVNNSFNGSAQSCLKGFIRNNNINGEIVGLQFFKSSTCEKKLGESVKAIFSESALPGFDISEFVRLTLIFEHLLFEPCGTATRFEKTKDGVVVKCESVRHENQNYYVIEKIQNFALFFISDYISKCHVPLQNVGFKSFMNMLNFPHKEEAALIGALWDDDDDYDKQFLNISHPIPYKQLFCRHFVPDDYWFEGLLSLKSAPMIVKWLYKFRMRVNYYRRINLI